MSMPLLKFKAYTILHWGAKHGNEDIIKLFAGRYKVDVNSKTNGGYTPLHLAIQFGHKKVYNLLIEVYCANADIRDFSGRKPSQYKPLQMQAASKDTYSEYSFPKPEKHEFRTKHHSFLRKSFTPNQRRYKSAIEKPTNISSASQSRFYDTRLPK